MARRCKNTGCAIILNAAKNCTDIIEKKGYCSVKCLADHQAEKRIKAQERKERKAMREAKEKLKSRSDYAKEAQAAFNAYIRERDKGLPCVSCDKPDDGTHQRHASHYRSRGACPELAYEPLNVHASCAQCNNIKSGNIVEYRLRLVKRIGEEKLEWLEGPHEPKKYTIDELKKIKAEYKAKLKALKSGDI